MKKNVGVIIGRFQVPALTEAHKTLVQTVAEKEQGLVVVLLGVSVNDGRCPENPLTFMQRAKLFANMPQNVMVLPLMDCPTDAEWSEQVDTILHTAYPPDRYNVTLYGGRKSFRESYCGRNSCVDIDLNIQVSGTEARFAVQEADTPEFLAGQVYALQTQYPKVYPTVDCVIWRKRDETRPTEILLIQRPDTKEWSFPGGFVDPEDASYALACAREVYEELGLSNEYGLDCVGSVRVNDWRYRGTRDKIITTVFVMQYAWGPVRPNPEEVQDYQWVPVSDVRVTISETHKPLWRLALERFAIPDYDMFA